MAPTSEEELKLRMFNGELSHLGPAERFLKALVDIPFAFKRLEALLFMCTLQEEVAITKESFETLEVGDGISKLCHLFLLAFVSHHSCNYYRSLRFFMLTCEKMLHKNCETY